MCFNLALRCVLSCDLLNGCSDDIKLFQVPNSYREEMEEMTKTPSLNRVVGLNTTTKPQRGPAIEVMD